MNTRLLDALKGTNTGRPPIWIMRQAGRYMPQYRALRAKHSFLDMCHQPELIAQITQMPLNTFGFDAAILFSDILVIPEALGVGLRFEENIGPIIERPLKTPADIAALPPFHAEHSLQFVKEGIRLLKTQLNVPLIGFTGAPFTIASYMIEGGSSRDLKKTKQWMLRDPASFHQLLSKIADCAADYLNMQIDAGVDALQIFDSWANYLGHTQFREFSLDYLQKILSKLKKEIPIIIYCKGSSTFAPHIAEISPSCISLDWNADLIAMRKVIPQNIALQGNLDPDILYADKATIQKEARRLLQGMQHSPNYIFNLGHGIHPDTPTDAVKTLVETISTG